MMGMLIYRADNRTRQRIALLNVNKQSNSQAATWLDSICYDIQRSFAVQTSPSIPNRAELHTIEQTWILSINRQPTPPPNHAFSCTPGAAVQPLGCPIFPIRSLLLRICQVCTIWRGHSLQQRTHTHIRTHAYMHTCTQTDTITHSLQCVPGVTIKTDPYHSPPAPVHQIYRTTAFQNASISWTHSLFTFPDVTVCVCAFYVYIDIGWWEDTLYYGRLQTESFYVAFGKSLGQI